MLALFVVNAPVFGGGHNQIIRLREPLAQRGWQTLAVLPDAPGNAVDRLRDANVETVALPLHRLRATANPRAHALFAFHLRQEVGLLRQLVRRRRVDLVQAHGATQPHAALATRREKAALVWELYDTRAPMALRRLAMPFVTKEADAITTWGRAVARAHPGADSINDRLVTVFPPVDAREFRPDPRRRAAARAELGIPDDTLLVGSVGNQNPQKGHEHLVRAAPEIISHVPNARFRVIGGEGTHPDYERFLRGEVKRLGLVGNRRFEFFGSSSRIAELLPGFDALALTSVPRSEGMPTVIVEAMACGLPVIATDVAAVSEVVDHEVTGLIVEPEKSDRIAEATIRLLSDAAERRRMGKAARAQALERFDIERCAELRVSAFELALEHRRKRSP